MCHLDTRNLEERLYKAFNVFWIGDWYFQLNRFPENYTEFIVKDRLRKIFEMSIE